MRLDDINGVNDLLCVRRNPEIDAEASHGLTRDEIAKIKSRGYEILERINEGQTRTAYLVRYKSGKVSKLRVLKIPKGEVSPDSICTIINRSKRDLDLREVIVLNEVYHPNIAEVLDSFSIGGRTFNVEAYYEGSDLEQLVKRMGPLKDPERIRSIFSQLISAVKYLNLEEGILHRDIKPSNILVTRNGTVKLTDLQNAAKISEIKDRSMPTRGGTPYTHVELLNSLLTGRTSSASPETEMYAVGATLYYALTGENPFNYRIIPSEDGREIKIGNEVYHIKLKDREQEIKAISEERHERNLKAALKKVPKRYRNLVYRSLTLNRKKRFNSIIEMESELERASSTYTSRLKQSLLRGARYAVPIAATLAVLGGSVTLGIKESKREPEPRAIELVLRQSFPKIELSREEAENMGWEQIEERNYFLGAVVPYMEKAKKRWDKLDEKTKDKIRYYSRMASIIYGVDRRLATAVFATNYLIPDKFDAFENSYDKRMRPSYVPEMFFRQNTNPYVFPSEDAVNSRGALYLRILTSLSKNVEDIIANYYSSSQEISTARARVGCASFYPNIDKRGESSFVIEAGYGQMLPLHQYRLINTAIAIFSLTDEDGNIDFGRIPEIPGGKGGKYARMISIPPPGQ